jgi:hypothetical protein
MRLLDISGQAPSSRQLVKQRLSFLHIERIEAFAEPAIDRSKQIARFIPLAKAAGSGVRRA